MSTTQLVFLQLDKNANFVDIKVEPKVDFQFQVMARVDKGPNQGYDWNKSPLVDFRTLADNQESPRTLESSAAVNKSDFTFRPKISLICFCLTAVVAKIFNFKL